MNRIPTEYNVVKSVARCNKLNHTKRATRDRTEGKEPQIKC